MSQRAVYLRNTLCGFVASMAGSELNFKIDASRYCHSSHQLFRFTPPLTVPTNKNPLPSQHFKFPLPLSFLILLFFSRNFSPSRSHKNQYIENIDFLSIHLITISTFKDPLEAKGCKIQQRTWFLIKIKLPETIKPNCIKGFHCCCSIK